MFGFVLPLRAQTVYHYSINNTLNDTLNCSNSDSIISFNAEIDYKFDGSIVLMVTNPIRVHVYLHHILISVLIVCYCYKMV